MFPFQERKKLRRILYSNVTLVVLFGTLVLVAQGAWNIHKKAVIAETERDEAARTLEGVQKRTAELQASLVRLHSEQGVEEELRQKFTVAKPGEEVVVIVDEGTKKGENDGVSEKGLWGRFLGLFWKE